MRLLSGVIVAWCLSLPSLALPSPQEKAPSEPGTPPAATAPTQPPSDKQSAPQADKPAPQDSKPAAKPETATETKTEQQHPTTAEPSTVGSQNTNEPSNPPKLEPKNKPVSAQSKPRTKTHVNRKLAAQPAPTPSDAPRRIVVREGSAAEPETQIVSNMTPEEASRRRQNTEDLLNSTRDILQQLSARSLVAQRQETVSQIHNYMEGSRSALKEGDISRAHTLALKANLLADDLARH